MSKKFKTKNSKYKSALFGAVAVAASFAMFASACTPASDDGEEESNTSTRVDEQILKNGNFEFFNDNDGTYILGSADNWSSATDSGATSSDSASGVIGTTAAAWNRLTQRRHFIRFGIGRNRHHRGCMEQTDRPRTSPKALGQRRTRFRRRGLRKLQRFARRPALQRPRICDSRKRG